MTINETQANDKKIENLKRLWQDFNENYDKNKRQQLKKEKEEIDAKWLTYRNEITEGNFKLEKYTNRKPENYLCHFLEIDSSRIYGSSRPGNANNFMIKMNEDKNTYTFFTDVANGKSTIERSREEAEVLFAKEIKPIFLKLIEAKNAEEISALIADSDYNAKYILLKIQALENSNDFIYIYSDDNIESLYDEFCRENGNESGKNRFQKNHEVRTKLNDILDIDTDDPMQSILLSGFMWEYLNTKSIVDESSPNVILYGAPGTGKTFSVKNSLSFLCKGDTSRYEFIQFHPSFTYEDFIEGIKPKGVTKDGNIKFELVNGVFKKFCIKAKNDPARNYYFVVDEINRANLSTVFGETLSLLEKDYRHDPDPTKISHENLIKTQYSTLIESLDNREELAYKVIEGEVYFGVPKNVFFIGMMNDVDKSIDTFDLALRRRFKWIRKDCDYEVVKETLFKNKDEFENIEDYGQCAKKLNKYISDELGLGRSYEFGHSFFMKIADIAKRKVITDANLKQLFEEYLRPTLKEYLRAFYPENEIEGVNGKGGKLAEALNAFQAPLNGGKKTGKIQ